MRDLDVYDPFLEQMFARMSPGARDLFASAQLDEIKRAFSGRSFGCHAMDWRFRLRLFGKSFYVVFLAGRERRSRTRRHAIRGGALLRGACTVVLVTAIVTIGFAVFG